MITRSSRMALGIGLVLVCGAAFAAGAATKTYTAGTNNFYSYTNGGIVGVSNFYQKTAYGGGSDTSFTTPTGSIALTLPEFNSSLGTLTGVQVQMSQDMSHSVKITNTGSAATFSATFSGEGNIVQQGGAGLSTQYDLAGGTAYTTGGQLLNPGGSFTFTAGAANGFDSSLTSTSSLSSYIGNGNLTYWANADAAYVINGSSNFGFANNTTAESIVTITYMYTATPEPGVWAFLGAGALTGAGMFRRKMRRKTTAAVAR